MEVTIHNFRGIEQQRYVFQRGTNLLKGDNGVGKTSIFEAIKWCLYGNMKNIIPWGEKNTVKIKVEIKIGDMTITRTNHPDTVEIISKGKKYQDKEKIIDIFGTRSLWETCSYLTQGERNFLLQSSQKEKTEIIRELLFDITSEESDWYKDRFEKYKSKLKENNCVRSGEIEILRKDIDSSEPDKKEIRKAIKRKEDLLFYEKVEKKYHDVGTKIDEYEKFRDLKEEQEDNISILNSYPFPINWESFEKWKEYQKLRNEILALGQLEKTSLTKEELVVQERIKNNNKKILSELNLSEKEDIKMIYQQSIKERDNFSAQKERKKLVSKARNLESELQNMEEEKQKMEKKKIFSRVSTHGIFDPVKWRVVRDIYQELRDGIIKECPKCQAKLLLDANSMLKEASECDQEGAEKKIKTLDKMIKFFDSYRKIENEISNLNQKISHYPEYDSDQDLEQIEKKCELLSSYNPVDINYHNYQACLNFLRKKEIEQRIEIIYRPEFDHPLPENSDYVEKYMNAKNSVQKYEQFIKKYNIIDEDEYDQKKEKRSIIREELRKLDRVKDVLVWSEIKGKLLDIGQNNDKISKASVLSDKIETLVNQNLQLFLSDFNNMINEILSDLIEDMSIHLSLFKTTKVKKKTKCSVTVEIDLRGNKFDNFNVLSGGQKDVLSLAFTLVFAKLCDAKFVFLDEFMSSLNEEMRLKCLNAIKTFCADRIVVNVCHETVEGYYDNIVSVC